MRDAHGHDCWGFTDRRPWYVRLWRWFFPIRTKDFTTFTPPLCFYTHNKRETLVKIMTEKPDDAV